MSVDESRGSSLKVAIYVTGAQWPPEKDRIISGHVQIPLKTAEILLQKGHQVTFITTEAPADYRIPPVVSLDGLDVKTVTKATRDWPDTSFDILKAGKQFLELRRILYRQSYDVIHFFGAERTAYLLGLIKATGIRTTSLMTLTNFQGPSNHLRMSQRWLLAHIDQFLTLTDYTARQLGKLPSKPVKVTSPGSLKSFSCGKGQPFRFRPRAKDLVLFWRNANSQDGADICAEAFKRLSREFDLVDFVFAVRPHDQLQDRLQRLAAETENIHLLLYPYPNGITVADLVCSASCVVMPFRKLTMNPQMAILETLSSGVPLVTTHIESNCELVKDHRTGYLVQPSNVSQICSAISRALSCRTEARRIAGRAKFEVSRAWNWRSYTERLKDAYRSASLNSCQELAQVNE